MIPAIITGIAVAFVAVLIMLAMYLSHREYLAFVKNEARQALFYAKTECYSQGWMHGMRDEIARQKDAVDRVIANELSHV